jgi:hypothetical protein
MREKSIVGLVYRRNGVSMCSRAVFWCHVDVGASIYTNTCALSNLQPSPALELQGRLKMLRRCLRTALGGRWVRCH